MKRECGRASDRKEKRFIVKFNSHNNVITLRICSITLSAIVTFKVPVIPFIISTVINYITNG